MSALLAIAFMAAGSASAQDSVWIGGSGFVWNTIANWQSGLVPNASRDAFVNNGGTANITFTGAAQARSLTLGENVGQSGTVHVFMGNSLNTGSGINVGRGGSGTLAISGGGDVTSSEVILGQFADSTGAATVTGTGSSWRTSGTGYVGISGSGTLLVENGGEFDASTLYVGSNAGSTGLVTVTGVGSSLDVFVLVVASAGAGMLRVENSGTVISTGGSYIGSAPGTSEGGNGDVTVTGPGSLWRMRSAVLYIGGLSTSTGSLTISDGGAVTVEDFNGPGEVRINALSTLNIGAGGLAGTLDTSGGSLTDPGTLVNNGALNFNHTDAITQSAAISGSGSIDKTGAGSTTLTNASAFTGSFVASGGELILQSALNASLLRATPGGMLRFDGSTVNLSGVSAIRASGGEVEYVAATVNGGILRGDSPGTGTHTIVSSGLTDTKFNGVAIQNSVDLIQYGYANFTNVTNGGRLTSNQSLFYDGGVNTTSGHMIVNQLFTTRDFTNNGQITVNAGGNLRHMLGNLASGGGSRTTVNPGGEINLLPGSELDLNGALLVNNGTIHGTTNVNYGSLATGAGSYGVVNVNQGGVFSPGSSHGTVTVDVLHIASASLIGAPVLAIELAGAQQGSQYDHIDVNGALSLGGTLNVALLPGFNPSGQSFDILDWGNISGTFSSLVLPTLAGLAWDTSQLYTTGVLSVVASTALPGDYNQNGKVDAADYVVWRKGLGTTYTQDDYSDWQANFGATLGSGSSQLADPPRSSAIAEPTCALLFSSFGAIGLWRHRCRFHRRSSEQRNLRSN